MQRIAPRLIPPLLAFVVAGLCASLAGAQDQRYTVGLRGMSLEEALEQFVEATGLALSYDPRLVRDRRTFCALSDETAEDLLHCILQESRLDFYRLSSGTFVITERAERPPRYGYVSGSVFDLKSGAPLPDAHVQLVEAGSGVLTNRSGQFIFPSMLPGEYAMRISHVGYQTWWDTLWVRPERQSHAMAAMRPMTIFSEPVVVDARSDRLSGRLGRSSVVRGVAGADFRPFADQPYLRADALPGVRLNDVTADVHIQGADAGAHELRLDGVPVFLPRATLGLIGPFSSFALSNLTVEKAGFDVTRGSHAGGVILAEHAVDGRTGLDVEVDPLSANARLRAARQNGRGRSVAFMAAGRRSLWDLRAPRTLHAMLEDWTQPDPFLAIAATPAQPDAAPAIPPALHEGAPTSPELAYADFHAAARLRFNPLHTVSVSGYSGTNRLSGGMASRGGGSRDQTNEVPSLVLRDDYAWENVLGQLRYDVILGGRTLLGSQFRASRYRLRHGYRSGVWPLGGDDDPPAGSEAPATPVEDANEVRMVAVETVLDHAVGRHLLRLGGEASHTRTAFHLSSVGLAHVPEPERFASGDVLREGGRPIRSQADGWRAAVFLNDNISLSQATGLEAGLRLTYAAEHEDVFAEPRVALYHDRSAGPFGAWGIRSAVGVYRQFLNQLDLSQYSVGSMLPTIRIWLPLDASIRPPLVYHLSQTAVLLPAVPWRIGLEAYYKYQPHSLFATYLRADGVRLAGDLPDQALFLAPARGHGHGLSASLEWSQEDVQLTARYEYSHAVQQSELLFSGRTHTVPWNEPHRLDLSADWRPVQHLSLRGRVRAIYGVAWGFRQAYYNYLGHGPSPPIVPGFDLSTPSDHVLPPIYQVDLGVAFTQPTSLAAIQLRADVINLLGRRNVADWRLEYEDDSLTKVPRLLYPRLLFISLRVAMGS